MTRYSAATAPIVFREVVVFLPDDGAGAEPLVTARAFTQALGVGHVQVGTDLLTGAVEIRFLYDPTLFAAAREYARVNGIVCEIDRR